MQVSKHIKLYSLNYVQIIVCQLYLSQVLKNKTIDTLPVKKPLIFIVEDQEYLCFFDCQRKPLKTDETSKTIYDSHKNLNLSYIFLLPFFVFRLYRTQMYPWGWYGISMVGDAALQTALISQCL